MLVSLEKLTYPKTSLLDPLSSDIDSMPQLRRSLG